MTATHEHHCVRPLPCCPKCAGSDVYYDNQETNEWGTFRDAHCVNCTYWWCEEIPIWQLPVASDSKQSQNARSK